MLKYSEAEMLELADAIEFMRGSCSMLSSDTVCSKCWFSGRNGRCLCEDRQVAIVMVKKLQHGQVTLHNGELYEVVED